MINNASIETLLIVLITIEGCNFVLRIVAMILERKNKMLDVEIEKARAEKFKAVFGEATTDIKTESHD